MKLDDVCFTADHYPWVCWVHDKHTLHCQSTQCFYGAHIILLNKLSIAVKIIKDCVH